MASELPGDPTKSTGDMPVIPAADEVAMNRVQAALTSGIPQLYCNGFTNVMSSGDVLTVFDRNGLSVATLNMSFTMAKSLSIALGQIVAKLEQMSGREILTTSDIERISKESSASKNPGEGTR